jgi:ATP-binding cassette subfamily B protein
MEHDSTGGFRMNTTTHWNFFKDHSGRLASVIGANALANIPQGIFNIFLYLIIMQLTLPVFTSGEMNFALLRWYFWGYAGVFILYIALSIWSQTNNYVQAYSMASELRLKLGDRLRQFSLSFFKQHDPGDIGARLLGDVQKAELIISRVLPDIAAVAIVPLMLIVFLFCVNAMLAGFMLTSVLVAGIFLVVARKVIRVLGQRHVKAITEASSRILEYFRTVKLLKAYNMTGARFGTMKNAMWHLKKMSFRTEVVTGIPVQIFLFCLDTGYLATLFVGVHLCAKGSLAAQYLFPFAVMGYYFYESVKLLGPMLVELQYASISTKRIGEIFDVELPSYNERKALPEETHLSFNNVRFAYRGRDVLQDISCHLPERSMTALVGPSGAGKTTLTSLIARFWDVQAGEVRIGGVPLTELEPDTLLTQFSMVFQDVYLFNDTIANNIRVGRKNASAEDIRKAARLARCDDFIMQLPEQYDTLVSEAGNSLSGGEKQRISIARAILKDAPIVILDEATASLDPENEAEIQNALENLIRDKTIVVIAHQLKSIERADQILVLDGGTIVERGTHPDLIEAKGLYCRLWEEQQKARGWKMEISKN